MTEQALVKIDEAKRVLTEARDLTAILEIRDRAVAMRAYAAAKDAGDMANVAKEIQLRAERKAGEFLADMDKNKGAAVPRTQLQPATASPPTLEEMGIEKTAAHRWQTIASVPDETFEQYIAETKDAGDELTSNALYKMGRKFKQTIERQDAQQNVADLITGDDRYRTIVIDPPWPMQKILRDKYPQQVVMDYPLMALDEIARLPISELARDDGCHLYLWVTHKFLPVGLQMVEGWGFNYQCLMTWVKPSGFTPYSWMYNTEHVIFAGRGNLKLERMGLKLAFDAPTNGHSTKPNVFYERVVKASPMPRLELFARQPRDGFTVWGNEI